MPDDLNSTNGQVLGGWPRNLQLVLLELFLGSGLTVAAAHLYRFSRKRRLSQSTGLSKAASLLAALPALTLSRVLAQLEPLFVEELTRGMERIGQLPPGFISEISQQALVEVFSELNRRRQDQNEAWLSLATGDPALAASICRRLCLLDLQPKQIFQ